MLEHIPTLDIYLHSISFVPSLSFPLSSISLLLFSSPLLFPLLLLHSCFLFCKKLKLFFTIIKSSHYSLAETVSRNMDQQTKNLEVESRNMADQAQLNRYMIEKITQNELVCLIVRGLAKREKRSICLSFYFFLFIRMWIK